MSSQSVITIASAVRGRPEKGVEVMTSTRVMSCDAHGVELEHGRLDADTVIWATGVVASPAARWLDAEHDRAGKVKVGADLSVCHRRSGSNQSFCLRALERKHETIVRLTYR